MKSEITNCDQSHKTAWYGDKVHGGVTGQQRMLTPPWHLILPSLLSCIRVALHSILYMSIGIIITFNTFLTSPFDVETTWRIFWLIWEFFLNKNNVLHIKQSKHWNHIKVPHLSYGDTHGSFDNASRKKLQRMSYFVPVLLGANFASQKAVRCKYCVSESP